MFRVELAVRPRPGVKDPQAEAVQESLARLGHGGVTVDAVGRLLSLTVECDTAEEAERITSDLCDQLLVNPNLETYSVSVGEVA
ncbi:MAG: phosphoribosylformylglycinamidine synthase subunit PurS [Actinomycetota bacterium]|jgi:phosphoribosylformylglycinamidine synthase|nr:phosphoribosylformylglycinamidine synthase subunit PurS [Actinomycetota bacterium]